MILKQCWECTWAVRDICFYTASQYASVLRFPCAVSDLISKKQFFKACTDHTALCHKLNLSYFKMQTAYKQSFHLGLLVHKPPGKVPYMKVSNA